MKNNNEKLTADMNTMDVLITMAEGNPGALNVLMGMIKDPKTSFIDILLCDSLGIRGSKLYKLHNDCCARNDEKFARTLMMLRSGIFTDDQIQNNLDLIGALPFIDDSIVIDGVPPYGKDFGPTHEKWGEFCSIQGKSFSDKLTRVKEQMEQQNRRKI